VALITPTSVCAICGSKLDRAYTATSGVAFPRGHRLWVYCDAPLHLNCLENWPDRIAFSLGYFQNTLDFCGFGITHLLARGDNWILICGPCVIEGNPYYAAIHLKDWPFRLYSHWNEWDEFITGGFQEGLEGKALTAAQNVINEVKKVAPNLKALKDLLEQAN
jgi:hypothetical protein